MSKSDACHAHTDCYFVSFLLLVMILQPGLPVGQHSAVTPWLIVGTYRAFLRKVEHTSSWSFFSAQAAFIQSTQRAWFHRPLSLSFFAHHPYPSSHWRRCNFTLQVIATHPSHVHGEGGIYLGHARYTDHSDNKVLSSCQHRPSDHCGSL